MIYSRSGYVQRVQYWYHKHSMVTFPIYGIARWIVRSTRYLKTGFWAM